MEHKIKFIKRTFFALLIICVSKTQSQSFLTSEILSYVNVLTCAVRSQPWDCVYQRSGRMFNSIQDAIKRKEDELKAQADLEFASSLVARGFSVSDVPENNKPSSVISSLQTYFRDGVDSISRGIRDRRKRKKKDKPSVEVIAIPKPEVYELVQDDNSHGGGHGHGGIAQNIHKRKDRRKKRKNKKGQAMQHGSDGDKFGGVHVGHGGGQGDDHGDDLFDFEDLGGFQLKKKKKHGRSIGVKRGKHKKKKKKKALMKLLLIGAVLKAKVELLLKIIGTHLQIKFFVISIISLIVNIARFWVDLKRTQNPAKVVHFEHAHHQHVYEDHDDGWGGSGSYWKRSLTPATDSSEIGSFPPGSIPAPSNLGYDRIGSAPPNVEISPSVFPVYDEHMQVIQGDRSPPHMPTFEDPHNIVYSKQMPLV